MKLSAIVPGAGVGLRAGKGRIELYGEDDINIRLYPPGGEESGGVPVFHGCPSNQFQIVQAKMFYLQLIEMAHRFGLCYVVDCLDSEGDEAVEEAWELP